MAFFSDAATRGQLQVWIAPAAGEFTRSVPVGVLVPCSGSKRIDDTLAWTLSPADVGTMRAHGVHAFLVGEAFMRASDPGQALTAVFR